MGPIFVKVDCFEIWPENDDSETSPEAASMGLATRLRSPLFLRVSLFIVRLLYVSTRVIFIRNKLC